MDHSGLMAMRITAAPDDTMVVDVVIEACRRELAGHLELPFPASSLFTLTLLS